MYSSRGERCRCDECRAAWNKYVRENRERRRAEALSDKACADCGKSEPEVRLQGHHRDPTTKGSNMAQMWNASPERMLEELAKCDILCEQCHKARHAAPHGTRARYKSELWRCRCDECTEASRAWHREHYAKTRAR